ncbi:sensor histidine kinase [Pseudonocardia parietis]|uniref:Oxygen sensor histidine kinase NreB n=1 Tax=Pseudonocardia parietis TaxID=570936 RepID=A0ABS4VKH2_9PSEU|nr:sensor histidine kinase [Pseudonocardia parietis]MBP2364423.1 signal transduction histidine kinase [Pseudonocardia parietis]
MASDDAPGPRTTAGGGRAGRTAPPPRFDRRIALALDTSSWAGVVVMSVLGILGLQEPGAMIVAGVLCAGYGVLDVLGRWSGTMAWRPEVLLGLQTVLVAALLLLPSRLQDAFGFLLVLLSIRSVLFLGPRAGSVWIAVFWIVSASTAVWRQGVEGLFVAAFNLGVYPLCGMVGYALVALSRSIAERADALAELQLAQARLRRAAVGEERRRLGRDLHDSVKQQVFAATMQLGAARALLTERPDRAAEALDRAEQAARRAGAELNIVIHELRSEDLDDGLAVALRRLTDSWCGQTGTAVRIEVDEVCVSGRTEDALLRVTQEALSNVARHADAQQVRVALAETADGVALTIRDDGRGYDPGRARTGVGVSSMEERVAALGGWLDVHTTQGGGTTVRARIPHDGDEHG